MMVGHNGCDSGGMMDTTGEGMWGTMGEGMWGTMVEAHGAQWWRHMGHNGGSAWAQQWGCIGHEGGDMWDVMVATCGVQQWGRIGHKGGDAWGAMVVADIRGHMGQSNKKEGRASHTLYMSEGEGGWSVRGLWRRQEVGWQIFMQPWRWAPRWVPSHGSSMTRVPS